MRHCLPFHAPALLHFIAFTATHRSWTCTVLLCRACEAEEEAAEEAVPGAEDIEKVLGCRPSRAAPEEVLVKFKGARVLPCGPLD